MPLVWDKSLSVNNPELDEQHRAILAQLRVLGDAIGGGHAGSAQAEIKQLLQLVAGHFQAEEERMLAQGYPHRSAHVEAHQVCLRSLGRAVQLFERQGPEPQAIDLVERSARWLDIHLRSDDLRMGNFEQGLLRPDGKAR